MEVAPDFRDKEIETLYLFDYCDQCQTMCWFNTIEMGDKPARKTAPVMDESLPAHPTHITEE